MIYGLKNKEIKYIKSKLSKLLCVVYDIQHDGQESFDAGLLDSMRQLVLAEIENKF